MPRKLTPKLIQEIVRRHLPRGWQFAEWDKRWAIGDLRGWTDCKDKWIAVSEPLTTRNALYVALHECAHARMHATTDMAPHIEEYEAEMLAIALMRIEGFTVPRAELDEARRNVQEKIASDEKHGWAIDPVVRKWSTRRAS